MAELEKNTDDPHSKSVLGKKKKWATFFLFNKHPKVETAPQGCKMAPRLENIFFFCSALKRCTRNPIFASFDIGRYCCYSGKKTKLYINKEKLVLIPDNTAENVQYNKPNSLK